MRRRPILLTVLILVAFTLVGGVTAWWFFLATYAERVIEAWAAVPVNSTDAGKVRRGRWTRIERSGFPLAVRLTLIEPTVVYADGGGQVTWSGDRLVVETRPWAPRSVDFTVEGDHEAVWDPGDNRTAVRATSRTATGHLHPDELFGRGWAIEATIGGLEARAPDAGPGTLTANRIHVETATPSATESGGVPILPVSVRAETLVLPRDAVFGREAALMEASVQFAPPPPRSLDVAGLDRWRAQDGTLTVEHAAVDWGSLAVTAAGALSLDSEYRPAGTLTMTIAGWEEALAALEEDGLVPENIGPTAKMLLTAISKPDENGRPTITAPVSLRDGWTYVGPIRTIPVAPLCGACGR